MVIIYYYLDRSRLLSYGEYMRLDIIEGYFTSQSFFLDGHMVPLTLSDIGSWSMNLYPGGGGN